MPNGDGPSMADLAWYKAKAGAKRLDSLERRINKLEEEMDELKSFAQSQGYEG